MKVIKFDSNNYNIVIAEAAKVLIKGGVIVYPTETAYGLGADFLNPRAVKKIYQIKGRDYKKPLSVIVSSLNMAKKFVRFNRSSLALAKRYWPGPLTLVLEVSGFKSQVSKKFQVLSPKLQTLGLRISSSKLATSIVKKFGRPITSTSANISGTGECFSVQDIAKQFKNKKYQPDLIIDAGKLPKKQMSTIVKVIGSQLEVIRQGDVKIPNTKYQLSNKF